jgi:uncharacterized protein (DUF1778 family)
MTSESAPSAKGSATDMFADQTRFVLPPKKWRELNRLLDAPPREIPRLKRLMREKSILEK